MRIYTKTGDSGETSLIYGKRVAKNDLRVEAYGTCDEVNSIIGLAVSHLAEVDEWEERQKMQTSLHHVQTVLFHIGSELATPKEKEVMWRIEEKHIKKLEEEIDYWQEQLPELKNFILPSGHVAASALHHARTVTRRAERLIVGLKDELHTPMVLQYMNRLSDYLFVAARYVNNQLQIEEHILIPDI
ncbi:cob(I)yrinic acid a,c-diamide adenosyltransferase [Gracilibacillus oryzae]|uniref:Corrinoid adenosyltransferase n=1 Tax=Gracilibacillus oryzae TaxID=1672701 RepID=A0A7C8GQ03_9BACI|nr:cob(I)yrinic acid a,c-diamide adenosyltransferase [Gracilibacillus oryzae]KAB8125612.1 cob(I)yrinic acid a,c-diamide adenosyltransferase [Gracilibacillus oryzae]